MKRLITPLILLAAILAYVSCKPADDLNPTPTDLISGYLVSTRVLDIDSPATKYTEQAQALFFKHPGDTTIRETVDSVRVNGFRLLMDNTSKVYRTSGKLEMNTDCSWQVYSATNVPSITYNFSTPFPTFTYALPDTVDRTNGTTVSLPLGMDSATISISANNLVKSSYKGAGGFLSPTMLTNINTGAAMLEVSGFKATTQAFGGKDFRFIKQITRIKPVWVK
jgi:hypothetical protein